MRPPRQVYGEDNHSLIPPLVGGSHYLKAAGQPGIQRDRRLFLYRSVLKSRRNRKRSRHAEVERMAVGMPLVSVGHGRLADAVLDSTYLVTVASQISFVQVNVIHWKGSPNVDTLATSMLH